MSTSDTIACATCLLSLVANICGWAYFAGNISGRMKSLETQVGQMMKFMLQSGHR